MEERWKRMIRFILGNEMLESLYWKEEDERSYKIWKRRHENMCYNGMEER